MADTADVSRPKHPPWDALVRAREDAGLTRAAFCRAVGVTYPTMIDLETGRRNGSAGTLKPIADYFGLTVPELKESRRPGGVLTSPRTSCPLCNSPTGAS